MSRLKLSLEGVRSYGRRIRPYGLAALIFTLAPGLALAAPPADTPAAKPEADTPSNFRLWVDYIQDQVPAGVLDIAVKLLLALGLFIIGWIAAKLIQWLVYWALGKTQADEWLAEKLHIKMLLEGRKKGETPDPDALERGIAKVVYWLVMALVVVAVLEQAGLQQAAAPIQGLVDTVVQALPVIGMAVGILGVAYIAALIISKIVTAALGFMDDRFAQLDGDKADTVVDPALDPEAGDTKPFSETAGQVAFWLVMLIGLTGAFDALGIHALSNPLSNAVNSIMELIPAIGIAALIAIGGWVLAKIARTVVTSALESVGFDKLVAKVKLDTVLGDTTPSKVVGWIVMAFILLQTAIAALARLGLATLSEPLTDMMTRFWDMIPALVVSIAFVALGVFVGKLLGSLAQNTLERVGFDRLMDRLGFGQLAERSDSLSKPSGLVGFIVQAGIVLLALVQAFNNLDLTMWASYVDAFLVFAVTRAAIALIVVGVGFAVGNYVRDLIEARVRGEAVTPEPSVDAEAPTPDPVWMAEFARYAVLVFTFTMALQQLGLAEHFVLLSFALLFGALCLAGALAFGLGGRELAGEIVREYYRKAKSSTPSSSSTGSKPFSSSLKKPPGQ